MTMMSRYRLFSNYRFNIIKIKIPENYFVKINKLILKFIWRGKSPRIANTVFKKNKVGELMLPDFKIYYKSIVIKRV